MLGENACVDPVASGRAREGAQLRPPIASSISSRGGAATKSQDNGDAFQRELLLDLPSGTPMTTEAVAKKVRRSADALAALAGEPDIGFVKAIGHVEPISAALRVRPLQ